MRSGAAATQRIEPMAEDLYLLPGFGNVGIAVTGEGVVMVDTGSAGDMGGVVARLRQITQEPVKYIIYTHGQADHAANAPAILKEAAERGYPRPTIIAHSKVVDRMNRYAELYGHNAFINRIQFRVPPSLPGFPLNHNFIRPDITYEDSLKFRLGRLTFELYHEMGETDDITWVYVPERKAVFSGDLYVSSCPNIGNPLKIQRYEVEWANALERIASFKPEALGPGHGDILRGAELEDSLLTVARSLRYLHDEVVRRMNLGQWEEQIYQEVELPPQLANHPAMAPIYGCPYYIVRAIYRRYGGWYDGNPSHLHPRPTHEIAAEVAALAGPEKLLQRAESLAEEGQRQLALHLLDFVLDGAGDADLKKRAMTLKSAWLKQLAAEQTSFISRSILSISAERIEEEAAKRE
jgi:alkyl sulfatase BDS1-like metallo-beta-lactamase superfamily hydrolase